LTDCQIARLPNCEIARLAEWQVGRLPQDWQIARLARLGYWEIENLEILNGHFFSIFQFFNFSIFQFSKFEKI